MSGISLQGLDLLLVHQLVRGRTPDPADDNEVAFAAHQLGNAVRQRPLPIDEIPIDLVGAGRAGDRVERDDDYPDGTGFLHHAVQGGQRCGVQENDVGLPQDQVDHLGYLRTDGIIAIEHDIAGNQPVLLCLICGLAESIHHLMPPVVAVIGIGYRYEGRLGGGGRTGPAAQSPDAATAAVLAGAPRRIILVSRWICACEGRRLPDHVPDAGQSLGKRALKKKMVDAVGDDAKPLCQIVLAQPSSAAIMPGTLPCVWRPERSYRPPADNRDVRTGRECP